MTQAVEYLPRKLEALGSNPSTAKQNKIKIPPKLQRQKVTQWL
jgi:hypothetical protein